MKSFLLFTDNHIKATTPLRRKGSYEQDVLAKLAFLLITAQTRRVDAVICIGDLFDIPNPSFRLAAKVMEMIASSGIPWFHVIGNHEVLGQNPDSYKTGVLAFFEHLPNFHILDQLAFGRYTIKAIHFRFGVEEDSKAWDVGPETILVAHAMITPQAVPFIHLTPPKVPTKASIIVLGHYHDPWANVVVRQEIPGQMKQKLADGLKKFLTAKEDFSLQLDYSHTEKFSLFLNPGSVGRVAALSHNLKRTPRAILFERIESNNSLKITSIPILVARPPDEVFQTEQINLEKSWEDRINNFLAAMENVKVEGIDARTVVTKTAKAQAGVETIEEIEPEHRKALECALGAIDKAEKLRPNS